MICTKLYYGDISRISISDHLRCHLICRRWVPIPTPQYKRGYEEKIKRHNKALENLAAAKEKFYENEVTQHDKIQQLRQQLADANNTNMALDMLRKVNTITFNSMKFNREPQLNDFYKPSDEMKNYQMVNMGVIGLGLGYAIHLYIG